jgi:RNA polymerase sigma factor
VGFLFGAREEPGRKTPEQLVREAQEGSGDSRDELIRKFRPFVLRVTSQVARRQIHPEVDEEFSVALLGLNEAVDNFDSGRGVGLFPFAETVIRRRLIDHYRREAGRRRHEVPLSSFDEENEEGSVINPLESARAVQLFEAANVADDRREEILRFCESLGRFGITLADLVKASPRHEDARVRAIAAARRVAADPDLVRYLRTKRELPLKELSRDAAVSRKTLERQRKYIIAVALILIEDFQHLREYVMK